MTTSHSEFPVVTNLENVQALNKTVLESSPDCLKILDTEGRLQFMNFNGLCQMEIDDFTGIKGEVWWNLWGEENEHLVKNAFATALKGKATEFSAFCPTAKGTPKWWHVTVTPVASADKNVYQLLSISKDITKQKKAEDDLKNQNILLEEKIKVRTQELLEKNIELMKSNAELAMFNYIASHDLQEPLRKIQIFSRMILEADNGIDETNHNFKRIIDATNRMRNLIDALHKFSVSKNSDNVDENCDLNVILAEVVEYSRFAIEEKNATVAINNLPTIVASRFLVTQLFLNILENALKYSREEVAPHISFSSEVVDASTLNIPIKEESTAFYKISIKDNGIGFQEEHKERIFEVFKRLHSKDEFSGTGIGLAICKTIVQKLHGWIEAETNTGFGATFIIYFPVK